MTTRDVVVTQPAEGRLNASPRFEMENCMFAGSCRVRVGRDRVVVAMDSRILAYYLCIWFH